MQKNNELVFMTRRYPDLKQKVLRRDSEVARKIIITWDIQKDQNKVLDIFLKEQGHLSDQRYWELMRSVWIIAGSLTTAPMFRKLMTANRKHKYYFSTPEEHKALKEMPEQLTIYRAANEENDGGISWTTSKEYAEQYKASYDKNIIIARKINKSEIFAYIDRNLEKEVIVF